jgi:ribosomal protein S18 acetylase RimI-like enzyme
LSFEVRSIHESERDECLALWCTVWRADNSEIYFRRYFYGDVEWLPYYTRVGVLDGRLVSVVQICKRVVACGEYQLTMGGIANVATLPEHRGHGYNTRCLQSAIEVMEADAMDFSLLFTGIHGYYAREGFVTLPASGGYGTIRANFVADPSKLIVRAANPGDIEAIYRIYEVYNRRRPLTVQRSPAYWRDWIGISAVQLPADLWVAVDTGGNVRGYVQCGTFRSVRPDSAEDDGVRILEIGMERTGDEIGITRALLDAVAERSSAEGRHLMSHDLGAEPAIERALADIFADKQVHNLHFGMARLLHRENLLRAFTMQWNERWVSAGKPAGILDFETPYGAVRVDAQGSLLRVVAVEETRELLPQDTLLGLIFGLLTPSQTTDRTDLHPLLAALFPLQAATYYAADGF